MPDGERRPESRLKIEREAPCAHEKTAWTVGGPGDGEGWVMCANCGVALHPEDESDGDGDSNSWTIPEFAAMCRERCKVPAQGMDNDTPCGATSEGENGEPVFHFCGRHWMAVL